MSCIMDRVFAALANENRLRIVLALRKGPLNVSEICSVLDLRQSNVSHHLRTLLDAGVVRRRGRGGWAWYSLETEDPFVAGILGCLAEGADGSDDFREDDEALRRCYGRRREESVRFFDGIAGRMDALPDLMPDPAGYAGLLLGSVPEGATVLDVGCGAGEMLARLAGASGALLGVDQSGEMLQAAGRRLAELGLADGVELRLGRAEHLPVADSSVDCVVAHMVLHHLGEPASFMMEAARVGRKGAMCIVADLMPHERTELKTEYGDLWPGLDPEEVRLWMEDAGFTPEPVVTAAQERVFLLVGCRGAGIDD